MTVTVRAILRLAMAIGKYEFPMELPENATLDQLLTRIEEVYGPQTRPFLRDVASTAQHPGLLFYRNHELITGEDVLQTVLAEGDIVYIASPAGGG